MTERTPLKAWILLISLSLIWGSSFILIKRGLLGLEPMELGALRIFAVGVVLMPLAFKDLKKVPKEKWKFLVGVALAGSFVPSFLFAIAQTRISSGIAGVLNSITPISTILIGIIFFHQKGTARVFIGSLAGLVGTAILILANNDVSVSGVNVFGLLVVLASILYATNGNLIKFRLGDLSPLLITSISLSIGGLLSFIYLIGFTDFFSKVFESEVVVNATGYIVLLGIMGTAVALVIFNRLVQLTNPVFTSSVTYIIPIIALIWGVLDGEALTITHVIGVAMILAGVYITTRKGRK